MKQKGCFFTPAARFFLFLGATSLIFKLFPQEIAGYVWFGFLFALFLFGMWWRFWRRQNDADTVVISKAELMEWVQSIPQSMLIGALFGGDRSFCVDEAVALKVEDKIIGVATIAPKGEQMSGEPTIVGVYILPEYRRYRFGRSLTIATIKRCLNRGFSPIRIDALTAGMIRTIAKLPRRYRKKLNVIDLSGTGMDFFVKFEEKS